MRRNNCLCDRLHPTCSGSGASYDSRKDGYAQQDEDTGHPVTEVEMKPARLPSRGASAGLFEAPTANW